MSEFAIIEGVIEGGDRMRPGNCRLISQTMKYPADFHQLDWPEVLNNPQDLVAKSIQVMNFQKASRVVLPVQDEPFQRALGVRLNYDWRLGIKVDTSNWQEDQAIDHLKSLELNKEDLGCFFETIKQLKNQGLEVLVEVSGVFTLMNAFLPYETMILMTRKNRPLFDQITQRIVPLIINYMAWLDELGVNYIYFADAVSGVDIVGPRFFKKYLGPLVLKIMESVKNFQTSEVLLCPRSFLSLEIMERLEKDPAGIFHSTACSAVIGDVPIGPAYSLREAI